MSEMSWRYEGACAYTDPEIFFPTREDNDPYVADAAKAICAACPVLAACREYALNRREVGIWGGLNADERRTIQRARARAAAAVEAPEVEGETAKVYVLPFPAGPSRPEVRGWAA